MAAPSEGNETMGEDAPSHGPASGEKPGWADTPGFRRAVLWGLAIAAIVAALLGFIPAFQKEEPHFAVERLPVFFAIYGFVMFSLIVLVGQHLRKIVGRDEGYYDERE